LTRRLRKAARRERACRYALNYLISGAILLILLAPLWLLFLLAAR
jgi:hypothetical protein